MHHNSLSTKEKIMSNCDYCSEELNDYTTLIVLPFCGYSICFNHFDDLADYFDCPICNDHKMYKQECFSMRKNKPKLDFLTPEQSLILTDEIDLDINDNFQRLKSQINLRRLDLKTQIDQKIYEYSNLLDQKIDSLKTDCQDKLYLEFTQEKLNEINSDLRNLHIKPGNLDLFDIETYFGSIANSISFRDRVTLENLRVIKSFNLSLKGDFLIEQFKNGQIVIANFYYIKIYDSNFNLIKEISSRIKICDMKLNEPEEILISSLDGTIEIWNVETARRVDSFSDTSQDLYDYRHFPILIWENEGRKKIICGGSNIRILDKQTGNIQSILDQLFTIGFKLLDNSRLLAYSYRSIKLWNLDEEVCLQTINELSNDICYMDILNVNNVVCALENSDIKIWDLKTGECLKFLKGMDCGVQGLSICDENKFLTVSRDGILRLWNKNEDSCLYKYNCSESRRISMKLLDSEELMILYNCGKVDIVK
ncbi:unnamed protein product [Brachionus calyciflorus]|uniref:Uncharacterized protein n=1 Tax=Brachionus calyciflorus TaxID=104777 RepID=A0A813THJ2_9BILA|nr:unnamed protein product [Brachionus calyciflorus]